MLRNLKIEYKVQTPKFKLPPCFLSYQWSTLASRRSSCLPHHLAWSLRHWSQLSVCLRLFISHTLSPSSCSFSVCKNALSTLDFCRNTRGKHHWLVGYWHAAPGGIPRQPPSFLVFLKNFLEIRIRAHLQTYEMSTFQLLHLTVILQVKWPRKRKISCGSERTTFQRHPWPQQLQLP